MKTVKELGEGTSTLAYWWLQGYPPVAAEEAQRRSEVCATCGPGGTACPKNVPEGLFQPLTAAAARAISVAFSAKWKMNLHVDGEAALRTCDACGCELKLKVWTPKEALMRDGKRPYYFDKLHADCWVRKL